MLRLERVLDLQIHYNQLENAEKELHKLENNQEISKLERICLSDKRNLEILVTQYRENEKNIRNSSRELEDYQSKLNKTEATIYNGEITDLKQLEHLNKEKTYLIDLIDSLENKIIDFLEKNDNFEIKINDWENKITDKEKMIIELEKSLKKSLSNVKKDIEKQKLYIEECSKDIEPETLEKFLSIKKTKDSGIATVVDDVCSECNMMIRPAHVDRIRLGKNIYTCENCGRILYLKNLDKE